MSQLNVLQKVIIGLSILFLILSMIFPSFYIDRKDYDAYANGLSNFFLGWMGLIIFDLECLPWIANPLFILALFYFIRGNKLSILVSLLATILALSFSRFQTILTSESGERSKITSLELGYKLWVASMAFLFIATIVYFAFGEKILKKLN